MPLQWTEPKQKNNSGGAPVKWQAEAQELRSRQGEWAIIQVCETQGSASAFRAGIALARLKAFEPAGSFEAAARKNESGTFSVYARYVGEQ